MMRLPKRTFISRLSAMKLQLFFIFTVFAALSCPVQGVEKSGLATGIRLVPFPKDIRVDDSSYFDLSQPLKLVLPQNQTKVLGKQIAEEFLRLKYPAPTIVTTDDATTLRILPAAAKIEPVRLNLPTSEELQAAAKSPIHPEEGYAVQVDSSGIIAQGLGEAGLYFAGQTVRQLLRANVNNAKLPMLEVRDWPSLRYRCFMDDYTRGPSPHRSEIFRYMDVGSDMKHNMFTYYMEYQFKFKKHPIIGPENGAIDIDDLKAMVEYGMPRHVTMLGTQQSFSHSRNTLKHPEYADMGEAGYILSPVVPKTYEYLDDLYSELCPVLPFEMFNVCCDETWDLGKGPSKELAAEIGVPGVYMMHIQKVHELLKNRGKRMMMWGDIIQQHPEKIPEIPDDMVMLCWDYAARPDFLSFILPYSEAGFAFFVCPGISNWSRMLCDYDTANVNIRNFVRDGAENGALGMLNTNWKDDGESLQGYTSYTVSWGGETAWNGGETDPSDFNRRIGAVLFGEKGDHFGKAIEEIIEVQKAGYIFNGRFWDNDFVPLKDPKAIQKDAHFVLDHIRPAIRHLTACQKEATVNADQLEAYLFGARRIELIATRMLDGLEAAQLYQAACRLNTESGKTSAEQLELLQKTRRLIADNRTKHADMGKEFQRLWNRESKPYALDWTMKRYENLDSWYAALLDKIDLAVAASKSGQAIPSADEIGLGLPEEYARTTSYKTSPREIDSADWHEPSARLRCAIEIDVREKDRVTLPIELDLMKLPIALAQQPVRAFLMPQSSEADQALEIPVQLDATDEEAVFRLTFLVPSIKGRLHSPENTDSDAMVCVYFGCGEKNDADLNAVKTENAPDGMKWVENSKVRVLLGPEGGHLYRWEVKAMDNRDLTLEGESAFSGFSDFGGPYRHKLYDLRLLAAGPAMVRYGCFSDDTLEKTVTLYADSSWCEVKLTNPTNYYWDFDTPKNFSADESLGGLALFSDGTGEKVGQYANPSPSVQVTGNNVFWGMKYRDENIPFALGLITPEAVSNFRVGPGGGMGGVGIESPIPRYHFVTFGGVLTDSPENVMNALQQTLNWKNQPVVKVTPFETQSF